MNEHAVSDWYETQALSDDIFLIREKYVAHWLRCNIWLVKGRDRNLDRLRYGAVAAEARPAGARGIIPDRGYDALPF